MSIEPVVGPEEDPYSIREEDLPKIMEEYDKLALEYIKREKEERGDGPRGRPRHADEHLERCFSGNRRTDFRGMAVP